MSASGAPSERTTAKTATLGLLHHDQARSATAGARMASPGSATTANTCVRRLPRNGRLPILKERMFGLTNSEGNHGRM